MDSPAEENPIDETLGDENQPGNSSFMKSPEEEAHLEESPKNDNFSGDAIPLGSPKREIHDEKDLESEAPLGDTVPIEPLPDANTIPPEHEPEVNAVAPPPIGSLTTKKTYKDRLKKMLKQYRKQKRIIGQLRQWLKETIKVRKLKVEMETTGTQTEHCSGKNVETQTKILLVYSKETQTEPCIVEESEMQTEDPCVFPQETQTDFLTVKDVVQTDVEESIPVDYCMIQEAAEATVQNEPMKTQDNQAQTEETPAYIPLVRE